jgi:hypothetical protein
MYVVASTSVLCRMQSMSVRIRMHICRPVTHRKCRRRCVTRGRRADRMCQPGLLLNDSYRSSMWCRFRLCDFPSPTWRSCSRRTRKQSSRFLCTAALRPMHWISAVDGTAHKNAVPCVAFCLWEKVYEFLCVFMHAHTRTHARVCALVCACLRACVRACVRVLWHCRW